ncbi:MAG: exodeoxyribonuclease I, partial [Chromatiales bacterium]|nr:exodeoxyribonuclease I [Chromatiales bacterium]
VLHVSSMFPAQLGCISMVVPLTWHPVNSNGVIVYDLRHDPTPLIELDEAEIHKRMFTPTSELPEGVERIPLKTVHINKSPVIAPLNTLTDEMAEQWQLNIEQGRQYLRQLQAATGVVEKIRAVHQMSQFEATDDPDQNLYGGGFFSDADRRQMQVVHTTEPEKLGASAWFFDDPRLPEMLFRYRARNWPETLTRDERERWDEYRQQRFSESGTGITLSNYRQILAKLMIDTSLGDNDRAILSALADWPDMIKLTG